MAKNNDTCACTTCGYEWKKGLHGGHSCSVALLIKLKKLRSFIEIQALPILTLAADDYPLSSAAKMALTDAKALLSETK